MKKVILLLYSLLLISFTIFSYLFIDPNFFYLHTLFSGFVWAHPRITATIYALLICVFFAFYLYFLSFFKKNLNEWKLFWVITAITICLLLFSYPTILSYDIFNYAATAKVLYFYHENPYIIMPIDFTYDSLLLYTRAANKSALYGPVWILLTGIPYLLSFGNVLLLLFNLKLFNILFFLMTIILMKKLSNNLYHVAFFALNPLVYLEIIGSSHNDIVMVFFVLFSFYLISKKSYYLSLFSLLCSILIKYATIFVLPVYLYCYYLLWRKKKFHWNTIYLYSFYAMIIVFFLSPIREELYPWYALWFLIFASFLIEKNIIRYFCIALSLGLMLRYIPYMLFGTYVGLTPHIRIILTVTPLLMIGIYYLISQKWTK